MFAASIGFLISVSHPLGITVVNHLARKGAQMLLKALKNVLKLYRQRGFQLQRITVDGESGIVQLDKWLATHNMGDAARDVHWAKVQSQERFIFIRRICTSQDCRWR